MKAEIAVSTNREMAFAITAMHSNFTGGAFDFKFGDIEVIGVI
ncbi:MAG: hypothetical protein U0V04_19445 [Spirosomataceae bacterium]